MKTEGKSQAICVTTPGKVTINNGTINGGIQTYAADVCVNGGTVKGNTKSGRSLDYSEWGASGDYFFESAISATVGRTAYVRGGAVTGITISVADDATITKGSNGDESSTHEAVLVMDWGEVSETVTITGVDSSNIEYIKKSDGQTYTNYTVSDGE